MRPKAQRPMPEVRRRSKVAAALIPLAVIFFAATAPAGAASRPAEEQAKIDWLLEEVRNSKAVFIRNGKEYDATKAVSHLKGKLLFAGSRVQTAKQFIVGLASNSSESGKPYEIRLSDGKQLKLGEWLLDRLAVREKGESAAREKGTK